ncbi:hypothetical protein B0T19DRAFT_53233 [Cercophora scortea]|uniref:Uncharacterized protein n=1 Tax=Cercophora scortea TaxID=314031 RepID=A0AAE0J4Q7_9PEZI|nr:hypothetical protein B0T19DRAFT_53233 [Cercophora scortea]
MPLFDASSFLYVLNLIATATKPPSPAYAPHIPGTKYPPLKQAFDPPSANHPTFGRTPSRDRAGAHHSLALGTHIHLVPFTKSSSSDEPDTLNLHPPLQFLNLSLITPSLHYLEFEDVFYVKSDHNLLQHKPQLPSRL